MCQWKKGGDLYSGIVKRVNPNPNCEFEQVSLSLVEPLFKGPVCRQYFFLIHSLSISRALFAQPSNPRSNRLQTYRVLFEPEDEGYYKVTKHPIMPCERRFFFVRILVF